MNAEFEDGELQSGNEILQSLTDERIALQHFRRPTLVRTRSGVRFITRNRSLAQAGGGFALESHRDQNLAALAEFGVPLSYPLVVEGQNFIVHDVLRDSIANFHLNQDELAWTAIAFALYLPPSREWVNRYNERFSFDDLTIELLERPLDQSSCGGTHLLFALTILARVNEQFPILCDSIRHRLWQCLRQYVSLAIQAQQPDGSWRIDWHREIGNGDDSRAGWSTADSPIQRVLATGHLCEWMIYLPDELQVQSSVLRLSGLWLYGQLRSASPKEQWEFFCPYSHAACVVRRLMCPRNDRHSESNVLF